MNCNMKRALLLIGLFASVATKASADGWVGYCLNPTDTSSPYSTDYEVETEWNTLFGAVCGVAGTINFEECFGNPGVTLPVAGRLGFSVGTIGSTQDDLADAQNPIDNELGLTTGIQWTPYESDVAIDQIPLDPVNDFLFSGPAGNWSYGELYVQAGGTGTPAASYFGQNTIDTAYFGASGRYFVLESTNNNIRVILKVDLIGDTARCDWNFTNTQTTAATMGFWFGQWVLPFEAINGPHPANFVTAPGFKPFNTDTRFVHNSNPAATPMPQLEEPAYIDFGLWQTGAYGLQVILQASDQIPDQTPVDSVDVGKEAWLLGNINASGGGMPDLQIADTTFGYGNDAFIQKWGTIQGNSDMASEKPTSCTIALGATGTGSASTDIIAYYRGTWSTSDYALPYSVVLDAPPVIGTTPGAPQTFSNAPFFLTVDVDNTAPYPNGFSVNGQLVPLEDVQVTVNLPQGMSDANNPASQQMTQYITAIQPATIGTVTFQIAVDPTLYGSQQYSVTVTPNPGKQKILTGTIVVGSQPYLQIGNTANLVSAPWQFSDSTWNTIIGANSGLTLDTDYQVFGWDPVAQSYVLQTGPQRGFGSFVVSNVNVGFVQLGGAPQQVPDLQTGAPQIIVQPGWNMIANPYNYAFPIGQIVGVPESDNQNSYTFQELVNQNDVNPSLAYWDPTTAGYKYTQLLTDVLQPNTGYWLYVQSDQPVVIEYPPVFQAFLPNLPDPGNGLAKLRNTPPTAIAQPTWNLPLIAQATGSVDSQTSVGQATNAKLAKSLTRYKPPVSPTKNAVWTSIPVANGKKTMQLATGLTAEGVGTQVWNWQVYTAAAGPVNVTWPAIANVPNNVQIKLVDSETGRQENLRRTESYGFVGKARSTHNFQVVVQTGPSLPVISSETATPGSKALSGSYVLSVNASTTVVVTHSGQTIATLVSNRLDQSGKSVVSWNYLDAANRQVKPGTYQLVVTSTPSGGPSDSKTVSFTVK